MHTGRYLTTAAGGALLAGAMLLGAPAANAQDDQNCDDFASQAEAQAHYRADTSDPDGLDRDNDGLACEDHPGYAEGSATDLQPVGAEAAAPPADDQSGQDDSSDSDQMVMPEGGVATGGGSTEGVENSGMLAAGGLALTLGAGGIIATTRRRDRA